MQPLIALVLLGLSSLYSIVAEAAPAGPFLKKVETDLRAVSEMSQIADWVNQTYITEDTTRLTAEAGARANERATQFALESKRYQGANADEKRQLYLLLNGLTLPAPKDPKLNQEMTRLVSELNSAYGAAKACDASGKNCRDLNVLEDILRVSRNPQELYDAWAGWHSIARPMKPKFERIIDLGNRGARELGFKNLAEVWKTKYDMPGDAYEKSMDRVWSELKPLYEQLHCYVRGQLNQKYGDAVVPRGGAIPAHLLGNMWAQSWDNIYDLTDMKKDPSASQSIDLTKILEKEKYDSKKMVTTAENFFVSLGMPHLPATFWERSMLEKPRDREVVCHASAWDLDSKEDVRIKMCIKPTREDFQTIHHELGHLYYDLAYQKLPFLYQGSANDGFHEGLGDTIQLSMTRAYLEKIGLVRGGSTGAAGANVDALFKMALSKVAFLPFGLMVDKWRWQVFSGAIKPADYTAAWWKLRREYQGVAPASARDGDPSGARPSDAFDPGAKYHVAAFVPYSRYFLAHIYQFQFHRALCKAAGFTGPLSECSIYGNAAAGKKLWVMMQLGASKPWQEALYTMTGERDLDATAIREYFAPLEQWLKAKNAGAKCGW